MNSASRGADRAVVIATLIVTTKLNDVDSQAWLADVLARIAEHLVQRLHELFPLIWRSAYRQVDQAA
jgi:transposase